MTMEELNVSDDNSNNNKVKETTEDMNHGCLKQREE